MLPEFLNPPMNESFIWVAVTLKFSAKTGLQTATKDLVSKYISMENVFSLTVQGIMRTTLY